jgi:hypothetical protein
MIRAQWLALAQKRLVSVLRARTVATDRTLEQKISDAGPNNQRIEPVLLTQARNDLTKSGRIVSLKRGKTPWFHLSETAEEQVQERLAILEPIYTRTQDGQFTQRLGQALEIAVVKALKSSGRAFLGSYADLDEHDDSTLYRRVDPPLVISGSRIEKGPLDYIVFEPSGTGGIEVKNYRTWLYPDSSEVKDLLWKCGDAGVVPVLIARRVPFITFRLLNLGGCLVHQNYGQLYAVADAELAGLVRDKNLLGYHDVRVGNEPDGRMTRFVHELLPDLVDDAKATFGSFRDLHRAYGKGEIPYTDWVRDILVRRGVWGEREGEDQEGYREDWDGG